MRSSKSRSRSKQNRSRSVGNIINRVFDSSGPEGKVRGTPQQIIDKYNQLARDAQLSNDRVAAENFQQHSEHYTRMLAEATREMEAQRQPQDGYGNGQNRDSQNRDNPNRDGGQYRDSQNQNRGDTQQQPRGDSQNQNRDAGQSRDAGQNRGEDRPDREEARGDQRPPREHQPAPRPVPEEQPAIDSFAFDAPADIVDSGLVETPESAPKPRSSRSRRPRSPATQDTPAETAE